MKTLTNLNPTARHCYVFQNFPLVTLLNPEAYSEPCPASKMKCFSKIVATNVNYFRKTLHFRALDLTCLAEFWKHLCVFANTTGYKFQIIICLLAVLFSFANLLKKLLVLKSISNTSNISNISSAGHILLTCSTYETKRLSRKTEI